MRRSAEAGTEPGEELYEVWLDMDDVEEMLFSELSLPRMKPTTGDIEVTETTFDQIARNGPAARQEVDAAREPAAQRETGKGHARRDRQARSAIPVLSRSPAAAQPCRDLSGDGRLGLDDRRPQADGPAVLLLVRAVSAQPIRADRDRVPRPYDRGPRGLRGGVLRSRRIRRHEGVLGVRSRPDDPARPVPRRRLEHLRPARLRWRQFHRRQQRERWS